MGQRPHKQKRPLKTVKVHIVWQMTVADTKEPLFKDPFWHFQIKINFGKKSQGRAESDYRTLASSGLFPGMPFFLCHFLLFFVYSPPFIQYYIEKIFHLLQKIVGWLEPPSYQS